MTRRSSFDIGEDLRHWLAEHGLTGQQLSDAINTEKQKKDWVSQSWVSRICNGQFKRASRQVSIVLEYANIPFCFEKIADPAGREAIEEAIDEVWDGSAENARHIAKLLRSAGALVTRRQTEIGSTGDKSAR